MFNPKVLKLAHLVLADLKEMGAVNNEMSLWRISFNAANEFFKLRDSDDEIKSFQLIKQDGEITDRRTERFKFKRGYNSLLLFLDCDDNYNIKSFRIWQMLKPKFQPHFPKKSKPAKVKNIDLVRVNQAV